MKINLEWIWGKIWATWEKILLAGGYDPQSYWEKRGLGFDKETHQRELGWQHDWIIEKLKQINWENLLEIGCGFGRNIKLIQDNFGNIKKLEGVEFSRSMINKLSIHLHDNPIPVYDLSISDPDALNQIAKKFDVILSHGVFMHIPFDKIDQAMANVEALSKKYLICVEETDREGYERAEAINKFTFSHNYKDLLMRHGFEVIDHRYQNKLTALFCEKHATIDINRQL